MTDAFELKVQLRKNVRIITFYVGDLPSRCLNEGIGANSYIHSCSMLSSGSSFSTTQMCLLMDDRIHDYDELVIREWGKPDIVIVNNHDGTWECDRTERQLRHGHNLFRLWMAGEFD